MKVFLTFCILFSAIAMQAQESLAGIWNMGQDNSQIEIKANKGIYEGRLFSSDNSNAKIGSLLLKDVKSVGEEWRGKLYSPRNQEWYDAVLKVEGKQLIVKVKSGWMSKTVEWTKE